MAPLGCIEICSPYWPLELLQPKNNPLAQNVFLLLKKYKIKQTEQPLRTNIVNNKYICCICLSPELLNKTREKRKQHNKEPVKSLFPAVDFVPTVTVDMRRLHLRYRTVFRTQTGTYSNWTSSVDANFVNNNPCSMWKGMRTIMNRPGPAKHVQQL